MRAIPKWQRDARNRYRRALHESGHRTFRAAMNEFDKLLVEHCHDRLTDKGKLIFEKLQSLRRLHIKCSHAIHEAEVREQKQRRAEDQKLAAILKPLGIQWPPPSPVSRK